MTKNPTTPSSAMLRLALLLAMFLWKGMIASAQPLSGILPKYDAFVDQASVTFQWNIMPNAVDYTVVLANDVAFTQNVMQSPPQPGNTWTSSPLNFGIWYWKVLGSDGIQSIVGNTGKFSHYLPSEDPNLIFWLKADQGVSLDGNGKVQSWQDQSVNNFLVQQTTDSKKPILQSNVINGFPTVRFQGAQVLNGGDILDLEINSRTSVVVGNHTTTGVGNFFAKALLAAAPGRYSMSYRNNNDLRSFYSDLLEFNTIGITSRNSSQFSCNMSVIDRISSENKIYQNNLLLSALSGVSTSFNSNTNFRFLIGAFNNSTDNGETNFLNGNIAEMIFCSSESETTRNQLNSYVKYKYSPELDLGEDVFVESGFCATTLSATVGYTNLLWSNGAITSSINISQPGTYWVRGIDLLGFVRYDTIQVNYPIIPTPINTGICVNNSNTWNADMGPGFTYLWSTGETTPSIDISVPGTYSVTVTGAGGCSRNSGNYTFTIDDYENTAFIGNDTSLCAGNQVSLQVGANETVEYYWNGLSSPSQSSFFDVNATGEVTLESINLNGCVAQDTIQINVIGTAPTAAFSFSNSCLGDQASFVDGSAAAPSDAISTWSWDLGDGTTLTGQSPLYTYLNPGTYTVDLYVETTGGCGDHEVQQITVFNLPTVGLSSIGHCSDESIQFNDLSTPGDGAVSSWLWNFGQPASGLDNVSVMNNPTKLYSESGSFVVYFQVSDDNGCSDDTTFTIIVDQSPAASFTAQDACENDVVGFSNTSSGGFTYLWNFGDLTTSILSNPVHTYSAYGPKTVLLDVTAANGCASSFQDQVYIHPIPIPDINVGPLCADTYVPLVDQSFLPEGNIAASMWVINSLDTVYGVSSGFQFDATGQQEILLLTTSAAGCSASTSQFVDPQVFLNADFDGGSGILAANENFTFVNLTDDPAISNWEFGDGSSSLTTSPSHEYSNDWIDSTLTVSLIVSNALGCIDTVERIIQIRPSRLDLALTNLYLQNTNGFYSLGVQLKNEGSLTINSADLVVILPQGPALSETWNGILQPGMSTIYVFDSQPNAFVSTENSTDDFICVQGLGHDDAGSVELDLSDNKICRNTEGEEAVLLPLYPNPASDAIIVQVLVSVSGEISLELTDSRGRLVKTILSTQMAAKGFYSYEVDLTTLEAGTYFMRLKSGDKEVLQKVMVIH